MRYQARPLGEAAEVSSGGGRRGMTREILQLLLLSAAAFLLIWLALAGLAELAVRSISPKQESEWLDGLLSQVETWKPDTEADLQRQAMLERVLATLTAHPDAPDMPFRIVLLNQPEPNAFAFPGGVIGVTRGLLDALGEEEIAHAFVIAHELGHFHQRDHLRGLVRDLGSRAAIGVVFGSTGSSLAGNVNQILNLRYSREQEEAADAYGIRLVESCYGETGGATLLFEKLQESGSPPAWAHMFSTHPDTAERIRNIRKAQPKTPTKQGDESP
jgi:Zn-dependent protease with chaperone function